MCGVDTGEAIVHDGGHGYENRIGACRDPMDKGAPAHSRPALSTGGPRCPAPGRLQICSEAASRTPRRPATAQGVGVTRYRVSLELDHGFSVEGEVRRLLRARREAEVFERPLMPGERVACERDDYVPDRLSAEDGAIAAWIATSETLRDPALAFRVIGRAPDLDAIPERGSPFDADAARAAVRDLRAGKSVATSTVVRLACHMLETT